MNEILQSLCANKLRTFLTGFAIAWGIFMLVVLLACGNGVENAIGTAFSGGSKINSVSIYSRSTTMPYNGMKEGRRIMFSTNDLPSLKELIPNSSNISLIYDNWQTASYDGLVETTGLKGVTSEYRSFSEMRLIHGRFITPTDNEAREKVIVIHETLAKKFFKDKPPLGKYITIDGLLKYRVVGVYTINNSDRYPSMYMPFNTAMLLYNPSNKVNSLVYLLDDDINTSEKVAAHTQTVRLALANYYNFNPEDKNVIYIRSAIDSYQMAQMVSNGISMFVWLIGIGTLIAGIMGVSNITLITVRERTREFGIRKALGAPPRSILISVISESLLITASFGYIGMLLGIGVSEILCMLFPSKALSNDTPTFMMNPSVDLATAMSAVLILIIAGIIAGYFPARRAVSIKPIEAMKAK